MSDFKEMLDRLEPEQAIIIGVDAEQNVHIYCSIDEDLQIKLFASALTDKNAFDNLEKVAFSLVEIFNRISNFAAKMPKNPRVLEDQKIMQ